MVTVQIALLANGMACGHHRARINEAMMVNVYSKKFLGGFCNCRLRHSFSLA
jgi:hypothetical protein